MVVYALKTDAKLQKISEIATYFFALVLLKCGFERNFFVAVFRNRPFQRDSVLVSGDMFRRVRRCGGQPLRGRGYEECFCASGILVPPYLRCPVPPKRRKGSKTASFFLLPHATRCCQGGTQCGQHCNDNLYYCFPKLFFHDK